MPGRIRLEYRQYRVPARRRQRRAEPSELVGVPRHSAEVLDLLEGLVSARVQAMNGQPVAVAAETISRIAPAATTAILAMISDAASSVGETAMHIASGAVDAMFVARVIPPR